MPDTQSAANAISSLSSSLTSVSASLATIAGQMPTPPQNTFDCQLTGAFLTTVTGMRDAAIVVAENVDSLGDAANDVVAALEELVAAAQQLHAECGGNSN